MIFFTFNNCNKKQEFFLRACFLKWFLLISVCHKYIFPLIFKFEAKPSCLPWNLLFLIVTNTPFFCIFVVLWLKLSISIFCFLVDHLTPGYYCTLPRNMIKRNKREAAERNGSATISRNNSLDGSMDEVKVY